MDIKSRAIYGKEYYVENGRGRIYIGNEKEQFSPYELLLNSLSACFFYTMKSVMDKKKIKVEEIEIIICGRKREESPKTLKEAHIDIIVSLGNETNKKGIERSADLAGIHCSIHATLAKVASITHEVKYNE